MFVRQSHPFHAYRTLELRSGAKQALEFSKETQTLHPRWETNYLELPWSSYWLDQLVLQQYKPVIYKYLIMSYV